MKGTLLVGLALAALVATGCAAAKTGSPRYIDSTSAALEGSFVTNAGPFVYTWAEYGPTAAYGFKTDRVRHELVDGNKSGSTLASPTGLERDTVYHYRICAEDDDQQGGPGCGEDRTFRTQRFGCGETVRTDIRLTGDMSCGGSLFAIGADGVDINLAGHEVSGHITLIYENPGILNSDGYDDVTVRNGYVWGFDPIFGADGAERNRVLDLRAESFNRAVTFNGGADNEIRHSTLSGLIKSAIVATGTQRLVVADNTIRPGQPSGAVLNGTGVRVVRNRLDYDTSGGPLSQGPALRITGTGAHVADNVITGPWLGGIVALGADHVIVDNQVSGSGGDGIFIDPFSTNVALRRNVIDDATDDGIDVQASGARLEANRATNNGDWGIDAVPGVKDLGGNTASGNGQAPQCRNIACG